MSTKRAGAGSLAVECDVEVPMRDGVVLRADVYRPSRGKHPALLTRLPYSKLSRWTRDVLEPTAAARQGWAVVVQDTRGCYRSGGEWEPYVNEVDDGADTVGWVAAQPWCDGGVGMYGASYHGYTQWAAASARPGALRALAPFVAAGNSPLGPGADRMVGFGAALLWDRQMRLARAIHRSGDDATWLAGELDRLADTRYEEHCAPAGRTSPAPGVPAIDYGTIDVPALHVGGWHDLFVAETVAAFVAHRRAGVPSRLLIGPWSHLERTDPVGEQAFGTASGVDTIALRESLTSLQLRWFAHWMKKPDPDLAAEPPVRYFTTGANRWCETEGWPPRGLHPERYYLRAGGTLDFRPPGEEEADCFVADPARPVPTLGGRTLLAPPQRAGPHDQRGLSQRDDVACYHGPVLSAGIEVTGSVLAEVWAMAAPGSQVVARLLDVEPSGREWGLTDGVADLEKTPERIDLGPVSHVFAPGHRVGLQLTWSSWPRWRPAAGGTGGPVRYHVRHDSTAPSHLQLPVRA